MERSGLQVEVMRMLGSRLNRVLNMVLVNYLFIVCTIVMSC
jgi:hypothetical protein